MAARALQQVAVRMEGIVGRAGVLPGPDDVRLEDPAVGDHQLDRIGDEVLVVQGWWGRQDAVDRLEQGAARPEVVHPDRRQPALGVLGLLDDVDDPPVADEDHAHPRRVGDLLDVDQAVCADVGEVVEGRVGQGIREDDQDRTVDVLPHTRDRVRLPAGLILDHHPHRAARGRPGVPLDVALVRADDQDDLFDPIVHDPVQQVAEDRLAGEPDHRLGLRMRVGAHPLAEPRQGDDDLHLRPPSPARGGGCRSSDRSGRAARIGRAPGAATDSHRRGTIR
jgi:hypothetical protein